ncbi:MFS transporter [Streptomyces sp. NPDC003015]
MHTGTRSGTHKWVLVRYMLVAVLVRLASEGARVGVVVLAVERTGSASFGGALVAALLFPSVGAAPLAGALADRVRRRRLFHSGCLVSYGTGLTVVAGLIGRAPAPIVLTMAAAAGCCTPLLTGGLTSLLSDLLPSTELPRAFSLDAVSYNLAGITGPALASALAAVTGPAPAVVALGAGAAAGGLLVFALPLRSRPGRGAGPRPAGLGAAIVLLVRDPPLRSLTWASGVGQLGIGALPVVCVLLATHYRTPWAAGGLMTAMALGSLTGSLAYAWRPWGTLRPERTVVTMLFADRGAAGRRALDGQCHRSSRRLRLGRVVHRSALRRTAGRARPLRAPRGPYAGLHPGSKHQEHLCRRRRCPRGRLAGRRAGNPRPSGGRLPSCWGGAGRSPAGGAPDQGRPPIA